MKTLTTGALCALALGCAAHAEVAETWEGGFTTKNVVTVKVRADRAYAGIGEVGRWWNNDHTYSGSAANMTLPLKAGGCFCETVPGGGVAHGTVVLAWPAQGMVRVDGALGPLQEMAASGAMTYVVKPKGAGQVEVTQTYAVTGLKPGAAKGIAGVVDGVVGEQLRRYAKYLETGKPQ
jgi:hypothetical protein